MASTPDRPYRNKRSTANSSMDSILDDTISPRISMDWRTALDRIPDGADPFADELDHTQWTVSKAEDTDHTYTDATRSNDVKVIGSLHTHDIRRSLIEAQVLLLRFSTQGSSVLHRNTTPSASPISCRRKSPTRHQVQPLQDLDREKVASLSPNVV